MFNNVGWKLDDNCVICCRVWSVQYNLFHDQLVLSGSSDSRVVLTRMTSVASDPLHIVDDDNTQRLANY